MVSEVKQTATEAHLGYHNTAFEVNFTSFKVHIFSIKFYI